MGNRGRFSPRAALGLSHQGHNAGSGQALLGQPNGEAARGPRDGSVAAGEPAANRAAYAGGPTGIWARNDGNAKPFAFSELLARLRALLRRRPRERPAVLEVGDLTLDPATHAVHRAGRAVMLTAREFALLQFMMEHPREALTRTSLLEHVWDENYAGFSNVVDVYVGYLRRGENAPLPAFENARAFHEPIWFSRTTNGADVSPTWQSREIFDPGTKSGTISNQIVVTPDGTLVNGFYLFKTKQHEAGNFVAVIRSTDKGVSWSKKAIIVSPDAAIGENDPEPINCRPFITGNPPCTIVRSDGVIIDLAVDTSSGEGPSSHPGRLYVTWQDHADNPHGDDLIMLSHSDDGGRTWSGPEKVNQTPSDTFTDQAFEPAVHVNNQGVVAVSYYDFRNDVAGDGQLTTDHWIVSSADGGATWNEDHLGGPFDMHQAPYARGYFVGDYQGLDSQGSAFRPLFTLASPGSDTVFPNPNSTDEFTNTAS
jgi:hypothetical protein